MTIARRDLLLGAGAVALAPHVSAKSDGEAGQRFLWGAATAAHQIEGNNINSDYWVLEHVPDTYFKEASGDACDSWSRWREDLALVKAAGLNAYRFSVEWARVEPEPGVYSPAMIAHYRAIFMACRAANIEPVVTFHHFTSPRWIAAAGGWENPDTADRFARYCAMMAAAFGPTLRWACTMNEPNAQVTSFILGGGRAWPKHPDFRAQAAKAVGSDRFGAYFIGDAMRVRDVCIDAHRKSRDAIKLVAPRAKVGLTLALQDLAAGPGGEALYRRIYDEARAPFYAVARDDDFIGVQSYFRLRTAVAGYHPADKGIERASS